MISIDFLGTGCMAPTKYRNVSGILLTYKSESILIDCGEGTQRQMKTAKLKPNKISRILITHWHGDHVLGLGGLLRTLGSNDYDKVLEIYGPVGTRKYFRNLMNSCIFHENVKVKVNEISKGVFFENDDYKLECAPLNHSTLCLGYSFTEKDKRKINLDYTRKFGIVKHPLLGKLQKGKDIVYEGRKIKVKDATFLIKGKKITFLIDTALCLNAVNLAKNSDVLVSEATFLDREKEMARKAKHLTVPQAVSIANKSKVKKLILTHISQRYKDDKEIIREAKFKDVIVAYDFMKVVI